MKIGLALLQSCLFLFFAVPDLKSANILRMQLQDAVRQKDISGLDNIIQEAENLAYPEIATDLRHARETLKHLGGGRGG